MSEYGERCEHKSWVDLCEKCEIDRLRNEIERLRAALWDIHAVCKNWDWFIWMWPIRRIKRLVRLAVEEK